MVSSDARFASLLDHLPRTAAVLTAVLGAGLLPGSADASAARPISYQRWATAAQLAKGTFAGTAVSRGKLVIATPLGTRKLGGTTYDYAAWTSPYVAPGFNLTELVPSWTAWTPGNTWVRVDVRGTTPAGASTGWDTISRWAATDTYVKRTSLGSQPDGGAKVSYDTWMVPAGAKQWQVRVTLFRKAGTSGTPAVDTVGAMVSRLPSGVPATSKPLGVAKGLVLAVPAYSQMIHQGEYPEYDGGGEAWCSPTSTSMVLGYYAKLPPSAAYAWVRPTYRDRFVDHAARSTFDYSLQGTGNWPFNTAYAATLTGRAFVTRMRSLQDAELFIAAGIPVVASISFSTGQLSGAPISATNGHLVVIVGFTAGGDVVVNDPAATTRIQRTYQRAQLEAAWLRRSGGLAYVITDAAHALPARAGASNW